MGNVERANCVGLMTQDDLRLSPSEYDETEVSPGRTGVTSLSIKERARTWGTAVSELHSRITPIPELHPTVRMRKGWGISWGAQRLHFLFRLRLGRGPKPVALRFTLPLPIIAASGSFGPISSTWRK